MACLKAIAAIIVATAMAMPDDHREECSGGGCTSSSEVPSLLQSNVGRGVARSVAALSQQEGEGHYSRALICNMEHATVSQDNLGNMGPWTGEQNIKIDKFGKYGDKDVTLVISNLTEYIPNIPHGVDRNGISGKLGFINIKTGTVTKFRFAYEIDGKPAMLDESHLAFLDLDSNNKMTATETVGVSDETPYFSRTLGPDTSITTSVETGFQEVLFSSKPGIGADDPTDPMSLDANQKKKTVQFEFREKAHIDLSLGSIGRGRGGRNIMYTCLTNVIQTLNCGIGESKLSQNNLGNMGPWTGERRIEIEKFGKYDNKDVTLRISNLTEYIPKGHGGVNRNGISGKFGSINVKTGTVTTFRFEFYINGERSTLDKVPFSFLDFDSNTKMTSNETVGVSNETPFYSRALEPDTRITTSVEEDFQEVFMSSTPGFGADNPTDPMNMDGDQSKKTVLFDFRNVSHIDVSLGSTGSGPGGRNMLFACLTNM